MTILLIIALGSLGLYWIYQGFGFILWAAVEFVRQLLGR